MGCGSASGHSTRFWMVVNPRFNTTKGVYYNFPVLVHKGSQWGGNTLRRSPWQKLPFSASILKGEVYEKGEGLREQLVD